MIVENFHHGQQSYASRSFETASDDADDGARSIALGDVSDVVSPQYGARDAASRDLDLDLDPDPDHGYETSVAAPLISLDFGFFFASFLFSGPLPPNRPSHPYAPLTSRLPPHHL